jgi:hypothetical protein
VETQALAKVFFSNSPASPSSVEASLGRWPSLYRYHEQKKSNPYRLLGDFGIGRPRIVFVLRRGGRGDDCRSRGTGVKLA